ncbi:MAG: hypothetical protein U0V74_05930 [Chitinophagales bacterium]
MKKNQLILALGLILACTQAFANILTVSNNVNSPGQFTTFAAAHGAASNGDTIYISGSPFNYGTIAISKQLTVIGTGHNPQKQSPLVSFCDYVQFYAGSNGSKLIGLQVYQISSNSDNVDNIGIYSCKITYRLVFQNYYSSNWTIDGNVFVYTGSCVEGTCYLDGITFRNDIFNGQFVNFGNCQSNYHYIDHCVFLYSGNPFANDYIFYVNNSIFYYNGNVGSGMNSSTWSNNISYNCSNNNFPNGTNQVNVNPGFVNVPLSNTQYSYSHDYRITNGAAGDNTASDGTDLGVYGGFGDFDRDGLPRIPYIKQFDINGSNVVAPGGTLNVTIKSNIR